MRPVVKAVERHEKEIRALEIEDVRHGSAIAGVNQDVKIANMRITDFKKNELVGLKEGSKSWENAFWKVFAIVVTGLGFFLKS